MLLRNNIDSLLLRWFGNDDWGVREKRDSSRTNDRYDAPKMMIKETHGSSGFKKYILLQYFAASLSLHVYTRKTSKMSNNIVNSCWRNTINHASKKDFYESLMKQFIMQNSFWKFRVYFSFWRNGAQGEYWMTVVFMII